MIMKNNTYDTLKKVALILAPLCTFIATLGEIWGLPHALEIGATLAALDTLLGAVLQICSNNYHKQKAEEVTEEVTEEGEHGYN